MLCCFMGSNMNNINCWSQLLHGCIFGLGWTAKSMSKEVLENTLFVPFGILFGPVIDPLFNLVLCSCTPWCWCCWVGPRWVGRIVCWARCGTSGAACVSQEIGVCGCSLPLVGESCSPSCSWSQRWGSWWPRPGRPRWRMKPLVTGPVLRLPEKEDWSQRHWRC